jgi:hypothetical protein
VWRALLNTLSSRDIIEAGGSQISIPKFNKRRHRDFNMYRWADPNPSLLLNFRKKLLKQRLYYYGKKGLIGGSQVFM